MESNKCTICAKNEHLAIACPYLHTPCVVRDCNATMKLLISNSLKNPQKKYLKCQINGCKGFQWLDKAILQSHGHAYSSSPVTGCFICGENNHWIKDCKWKPTQCTTEGCPGTQKCLTSESHISFGKKYLKCYTCQSFQWLSTSMFSDDKPSRLKTKVLIEAELDEDELKDFCSRFASNIVFKCNMTSK